MKYQILQLLFGWMCRGILLWNFTDWCMAAGEIYLIKWAIDNLKCKNVKKSHENSRKNVRRIK